MSVTRYFEWRCDTCPAVERMAGYGLPDKWVVIEGNMVKNTKTTHRCPECSRAAVVEFKRRTR